MFKGADRPRFRWADIKTEGGCFLMDQVEKMKAEETASVFHWSEDSVSFNLSSSHSKKDSLPRFAPARIRPLFPSHPDPLILGASDLWFSNRIPGDDTCPQLFLELFHQALSQVIAWDPILSRDPVWHTKVGSRHGWSCTGLWRGLDHRRQASLLEMKPVEGTDVVHYYQTFDIDIRYNESCHSGNQYRDSITFA